MTPLLLLALLAPSTTPTTINPPTNHQEAPMAQPISSPGGHPPIYHPPGHGPNSTAYGRTGMSATNPTIMSGGARPATGNPIHGRNLTPTEHTNRPTTR